MEAGEARLGMRFQFLLAQEARDDARQHHRVGVDADARGAAQPTALRQLIEDRLDVARRAGQHASHEILRITPRRSGIEPTRVRPEILELKLQLERIMAIEMERKRFGKERDEAFGRLALEAKFARVKGPREAHAQPEPVDREQQLR
jgi:hypothetical protein